MVVSLGPVTVIVCYILLIWCLMYYQITFFREFFYSDECNMTTYFRNETVFWRCHLCFVGDVLQNQLHGFCLHLLTGLPSHFIIYLLLYRPIIDSAKKRIGEIRKYLALLIAEKLETLRKFNRAVSVTIINISFTCWISSCCWGCYHC